MGAVVWLPRHPRGNPAMVLASTPMQGGPDNAGRAPSPEGSAAFGDGTEEFLFHLYRGGELLQDNRVHEARAELEEALRREPGDVKARDLLGIVYYRLGLYPRAIATYEELSRDQPNDARFMMNLSLCQVKTAQPERARDLLEQVVAISPDNVRAWSYLGLVHERLGSYGPAAAAFARAGQPEMLRRMNDRVAQGARHAPGDPAAAAATVPALLGDTFPEIDTEITLVGMPAVPRLTSSPPPLMSTESVTAERARSASPQAMSDRLPFEARVAPSNGSPIAALRELIESSRLQFPAQHGVTAHASGLLLCQIAGTFAVRASAIQQLVPGVKGLKTTALPRRTRGSALDEALGGEHDPMVALAGDGGVALLGSPGEQLLALRMEDDLLFVRETALVAFDGALTYESGRLAALDGEAVALVQLRGRGCVVLRLHGALVSTAVAAGHATICSRRAILGWAGRILPRELSADEAPLHGTGLVSFAGEGTVFASAGVPVSSS